MKRLFILGSARSGTTWVRELVGRHPAAAVAAREPHLFDWYLGPLEEAWRIDAGDRVAGLSHILAEDEFYDLCRDFAEKVAAKVVQAAAATDAGRRREIAVLIDKTPDNALTWRLILRLFPDAYFLHVIRDPRDVVCSLRAASAGWGARWAPRTVADAARFWRRYVAAALEIPTATERYLEVRYEALAAAASPELARILRWLGLPDEPHVREAALSECSVEAMSRRLSGAPQGFFRKCAAGGWREELSGEEVGLVELLAGKLMDRLGYERAATRPPGALAHEGVRP